jgi:hypothetical protein
LNATEALEQGVLSRDGRINHDGRHLTLSEAIDKQIVRLEHAPPATIRLVFRVDIMRLLKDKPRIDFYVFPFSLVELHQ